MKTICVRCDRYLGGDRRDTYLVRRKICLPCIAEELGIMEAITLIAFHPPSPPLETLWQDYGGEG